MAFPPSGKFIRNDVSTKPFTKAILLHYRHLQEKKKNAQKTKA
jgi:hypothetical protein